MGAVYEAYDRELKSTVALKRLLRFGPTELSRLKAEFRSLRDLSHPNLISLGELVEDSGEWFFTMELLEGTSLLEYVRPGQVALASDTTSRTSVVSDQAMTGPVALGFERRGDLERALETKAAFECDVPRLRQSLIQLAHGLTALHDAGWVHRDVKPSNLMVTHDGRLVILDLGLVTGAALEKGPMPEKILGTPAYMAPELLTSTEISPSSDWYSVGIVLYEALAGRRPVSGSAADVLHYRQQFEVKAPSTVVEGVPEDLDSLCADLLRIDRRKRPSGRQVLGRLGVATTPRRTPTSREEAAPPFVGRQLEVTQLLGAFAEARQDAALVVVVQGESGLGKSALVDRFLQQLVVASPGAWVLRGRCHERESVPFKAFDGAIDELAGVLAQLPSTEQKALLPSSAARLAQVFPVLAQVPGLTAPESTSKTFSSTESRRALFTAMRELFVKIGARHPLVLAIDDLQWADEDSLAMLREVLRPPHAPSMLVVCTARAGEVPWLPDAPQSELALGARVRHLRLKPLEADDGRRLAEVLLARHGRSGHDAKALAAAASGHPLFLQELAMRGEAAPATGELDGFLWERIGKLPEKSRALVEAVAVAGSPRTNEVLSAVVGLEAQAYGQAIAELKRGHLVRSRGQRRTDAVEPYHDRVRETVTARLDAAAQVAIHRAFAEAFETLEVKDAEALAHHWRGAGDATKAVTWARQAAVEADAALAFERAARALALCLELTPVGDVATRRDLTVRLGDAQVKAGHLAMGARTYLVAAEVSEGEARLFLERQAAEKLLYSGHFGEGIDILRRAMAPAGMKLPGGRAGAVATVLAERTRLSLRGLKYVASAREKTSRPLALQVDTAWTVTTSLGMIDPVTSAAFGTRFLRLALESGEEVKIGYGLLMETILTGTFSGLTDKVKDLFERAKAISERVDEPVLNAEVISVRSALAYLRGGDLQYALAQGRLAEQTLEENCPGAGAELASARQFTNASLFRLGGWGELHRRVLAQRAEAIALEDVTSRTNLASGTTGTTWLHVDEPDAMERELDAVVALWPADQFLVPHLFELMSRAALELYRGRPERAWKVLEAGTPRANRAMHLRIPVVRDIVYGLRAATANALAALEAKGSRARAKRLAQVEKELSQLARTGVGWQEASVALLDGCRAQLAGSLDEAKGRFTVAATTFDRFHQRTFAAAARARLGALLGGSEGAAFIADAEAVFRAEGVKRPKTMFAVLAPTGG